MELLKMIKDLQALLMAPNELPHVVAVRLLARLDEAERHLGSAGFGSAQPTAQPPAEAPAVEKPVESVKEVEELEEVK